MLASEGGVTLRLTGAHRVMHFVFLKQQALSSCRLVSPPSSSLSLSLSFAWILSSLVLLLSSGAKMVSVCRPTARARFALLLWGAKEIDWANEGAGGKTGDGRKWEGEMAGDYTVYSTYRRWGHIKHQKFYFSDFLVERN